MSLHISWRFAVWFPDTLKKQSESGSAKNSYRKKIFIKKIFYRRYGCGTSDRRTVWVWCSVRVGLSSPLIPRASSSPSACRANRSSSTTCGALTRFLFPSKYFTCSISAVPPCHLINCRVVRGKSQYYNMQLLVNVTKINFLDKFKILYFFNNSWILLTCPNFIQSLDS